MTLRNHMYTCTVHGTIQGYLSMIVAVKLHFNDLRTTRLSLHFILQDFRKYVPSNTGQLIYTALYVCLTLIYCHVGIITKCVDYAPVFICKCPH